jgi:polyphosphate kinase
MDIPKFTGRDISWLQFNKRVLEEAYDETNPLLEQLKFIAIFSSNLDEYFMIRVSGMAGQIELGMNQRDIKTNWTPSEYLREMLKKANKLVSLQYEIYQAKKEELNNFINLVEYKDLKPNHKKIAETYFHNLIFPVLTPIGYSSFLPFPLIPNLNVNIIAKLVDSHEKIRYSVVTLPKNIERVIQIKKDTFVLLEDIIINNIDSLYEGLTVLEAVPFRVTRDWDIEFDDQSDDFAQSVYEELKERKRGAAIRLEVDINISEETLQFLIDHLKLKQRQVFYIGGPLDLTLLHELCGYLKPKYPELSYEIIEPINPVSFPKTERMFDVLRRKDVLLFHPHHSYEPVIRLVQEASEDENVVAIKQTIYRTSKDSRIMTSLVKAAESGKQVTVLFELKARFDEENNLHWGNILERAGAHVIYGVPNLKTHSKVLLIVRRTKNLVERFVHFSTGNYNEDNAKIYTDASYFTSKVMIGEDATKFFNYISSFSKKPTYKRLIASPYSIKDEFFKMIDNEIENHKKYGNGYFCFKTNSVSDPDACNKIYEAASYGVKIDLIVRGICCVNPGIPGLSETITVRSIVGRYLEHMRFYYFYNNGLEDVYLSSADLMTRNMESRIELALKINDKSSKHKIKRLMKLQLDDNVKARINFQGKYDYIFDSLPKVNAQMDLYKYLK